MADVRGGGGVRGGTHARLVGEQPAAYALHDDDPQPAAGELLEPEGVGEYAAHHARQHPGTGAEDVHGEQDVGDSHQGYEYPRDDGDAVDAPEYDEEGERREDCPEPYPARAEYLVEGERHSVRLHGVEYQPERDGDDDGEEDAHPSPPQSPFHVEGGTADEGALAFRLVYLCQRRFDEGGRRADQRDEPHPEDGAGPAKGECRRHAREVARSHAGSRRDAESLKGGDRVLVALAAGDAVAEQAEHLADVAELHEFALEREI